MGAYTAEKRTFEAEKHPKGSAERAKLNESALTSEYMHSHKYVVVADGKPTCFAYSSKRAAEEKAKYLNERIPS